jgi:ferrous iron transport protein A
MGQGSAESAETEICNSDRNGRILNPDYSGRSFRAQPHRRPTGVRRLSVLSELKIGESAVLVGLDLPESVQNHLMHMGFVPDAQVTALRRAPAGDPTVYAIDGMEIALRIETAKAIRVREAQASPARVMQQEQNAGETARATSIKALPRKEPLEQHAFGYSTPDAAVTGAAR